MEQYDYKQKAEANKTPLRSWQMGRVLISGMSPPRVTGLVQIQGDSETQDVDEIMKKFRTSGTLCP